MAISEACGVLKDMEADGIIKRYALAGAVAAYAYIEAVHTEDLDALVAFTSQGVSMLAPIWPYLRERGYTEFQHAGVVVGGWPIEFLPVASPLQRIPIRLNHLSIAPRTECAVAYTFVAFSCGVPVPTSPENALDAEGLDQAQDVELEPGLTIRVLRPEHLVATALSVGRPKDHIRIAQFLEENAVDLTKLCPLLDRHGLVAKWRAFCLDTTSPTHARSRAHNQSPPSRPQLPAPQAARRRPILTPISWRLMRWRAASGRHCRSLRRSRA